MNIKSIQELSTALQKTLDNHITSRIVEIQESGENISTSLARTTAIYEAMFSLKGCEMFLDEKFSNMVCLGVLSTRFRNAPSFVEKLNVLWTEFEKSEEMRKKKNAPTSKAKGSK